MHKVLVKLCKKKESEKTDYSFYVIKFHCNCNVVNLIYTKMSAKKKKFTNYTQC